MASRDDPDAGFGRSRCFVDAGKVGHINIESDLGHWPFGQVLLDELFGRSPHMATSAATRRTATLARHLLIGCG